MVNSNIKTKGDSYTPIINPYMLMLLTLKPSSANDHLIKNPINWQIEA